MFVSVTQISCYWQQLWCVTFL